MAEKKTAKAGEGLTAREGAFEVLEKIKGYKQYGNRHLSKEKIDEYCNSVKEAKEKSLEK